MQRRIAALIAASVIVTTGGAAQAAGESEPVEGYVPPYELIVAGEGRYKIKLKQSAIDRLDIQTAEMRTETKSRTISTGGLVFEIERSGADQSSDFFVGIPDNQLDYMITGGIKVAAGIGGITQEYLAAEDPDIRYLESRQQGYKFFRVTTNSPLLTNGQRVLVEAEANPEQELTVAPYSALIYDKNGGTWVYVAETPDTFLRHKVDVEFIDGDSVYLLDGPPPGTKVVTVGAAELLGTEYKVGY
ncbi:hypothetical protein [Oricola cellulosilytica]|uniref:Uncharacterized protein n=1 Tax=Oricola cellulosilytica TaxID=1429082 RepID=A0A4R0PAB6_9HYPH|nr:hypothetical protein [Oricola cellulosilytica]TCD14192.1 hypothetical protein E0D97_08900 [Oricola cellulosilytica]